MGTNYFGAWDRAIATVNDAQLREASAARRWAVMKKHRAAADQISEIAVEMPALSVRLHDLNVVLAADPSKETLRGADRVINECRGAMQRLIPRIDELKRALKQLLAEAPRT